MLKRLLFFFLISTEIGHCQDTLQLNIAQIVDLCFSQSFTIKSLEIENEVGKSLLITAKIRPNLELNNQTLQLTDAKYFQAGHPSIDFSHQQNWTQLTKSIQFPGVRKTKINYAEAAYSTLMNQNKSESMVFLKEVMQRFAILDYHQLYHKILQKEINDILNIKKLHATKTRKELTLSEINRIEQIELFYNVLLEQNQIDLMSVQSILSSQLRTSAFFILDSFQFYKGAHSLLQNTFSVNQSVAFKTEDLRLEEYKLRKQMQEKMIFPPAQFGFIHNPQNRIPYWGTYLTIPLPIFNRNQSEIYKSGQEISLQQLKKEETRRTLENQWIDTRRKFIWSIEKQKRGFKMLNLSKIDFEHTEKQYVLGETDIIDFLEAERSLFNNEIYVLENERDKKQAYIECLYLLDFSHLMH